MSDLSQMIAGRVLWEVNHLIKQRPPICRALSLKSGTHSPLDVLNFFQISNIGIICTDNQRIKGNQVIQLS